MAEPQVVWVMGAGSGIGQATALAVAFGRRLVLSGRRPDRLQDTAALVEQAGGEALVLPFDTRDPVALKRAHDTVHASWRGADAVVLSAGLNSPRRTWADQSVDDAEDIIGTNLTSVLRTIDTVLPDLRKRGGQVVVVSSYSAWRFNPGAGVAYSASKAALAALCQTLNAQEAANGVRATHLCPGDVDSEFLRLRPVEPDAVARVLMLSPDDVGRAVRFVLESPSHVRIDELVISPLSQV